jgi:signal transduction histidine kinase
MLDYLSASVAFWMVMFALQEHLLKFRLDEIAHYWFLVISCSLFISFLLWGGITFALMINFILDPFIPPGSIIVCAIAVLIFGTILSLGQWLILRQSKIIPNTFALINTVLGILIFALLVWLNKGTLEWSGNPIQGWKTALIFLVAGAITGGVTGKIFDNYCERKEQRLFDIEREREEQERLRRERIENEIFERRRQDRERQERAAQQRKEQAEKEALERKLRERELALEEERRWYEEHPEEAYGEWHDEDEDEDDDE